MAQLPRLSHAPATSRPAAPGILTQIAQDMVLIEQNPRKCAELGASPARMRPRMPAVARQRPRPRARSPRCPPGELPLASWGRAPAPEMQRTRRPGALLAASLPRSSALD